MNKLMGFLELKESSLPTVQLEEYDETSLFDSRYLWTVRTAVYRGADFNLPRKVGVSANEAEKFAREIKRELGHSGKVFFYPYFIAVKSGNLEVRKNEIIIEAVKDDLWNLVTYSDREVTYRIGAESFEADGNKDFLSKSEIEEMIKYANKVRGMFRDDINEGNSILLEWSYAINTNALKEHLSQPYLVFYEVRTV